MNKVEVEVEVEVEIGAERLKLCVPHACSGSTVRVKRKMSIVGIAPDCPSYNEF